jgi:sugar phosphate permease
LPRTKILHGWWIVAAGCANSATFGYGLSVFYKRIIDDFGWTRTQVAGAISLSTLEGGMLGGVGGLLVDRFGPRPVMIVGVTLMSLGLVMLSRVTTLFQFYLVLMGLVAVGHSLSFLVPIDTTVANWFIKRRGTAFGLLRGAISIGAAGVPLLAWFITQYGWRTAFVAAGIGTFVIGMAATFVMRRQPEYYGLLPDGETGEQGAEPVTAPADEAAGSLLPATEAAGVPRAPDIGMTPLQALNTQAFWVISFAFSLRMMVTGAILLHAIPLVEDMGYSTATAAIVLGSIGVVSLTGRIGGGWLCDSVGTKRVAVGSVVILAISTLVLAFAQSLWMVVLFVAIYAPSYGCQVAAMPSMRADYFGRLAFGTISGLSGVIMMGGAMLGPFFAAYVYDSTGSYQIAFLVFSGLSLVSAALFLSLKPPGYR